MTEVVAVLLVAGCVYPTLRRWAVWRWLAALATGLGVWWGLAVVDDGVASLALSVCVAGAVVLASWQARPAIRDRWSVLLALAVGLLALIVWWLLSDSWPPPVDRPGSLSTSLAAIAVLLGLLGATGVGRAAEPSLRRTCLLVSLMAAIGIAALGDLLVSWAWLPAAGALGLTSLVRGRRGTAASAPQTDEVDERVLAAFAREHPGLVLPPVVVVIAAYNEAAGVPGVLASLPQEVHGLETEVLVVDDGSTDGTADAARAAGRGLVVACPVNRGQGRALRLGYRLAREHGATYVVTTDADGQYSPDDIPVVLDPVVRRRADFVTGSRRLGVLENRDAVRQAGTYLFAWLASALLGQRITDTSFGLRAMRVEVTAAVTLNQPQYQASELLVGVVSHGFRLQEVPGTMRVRSAGASKKGGNLAYGTRYARVLLGTWWREGGPRPVAECAPALRGSSRHVHSPVDARA